MYEKNLNYLKDNHSTIYDTITAGGVLWNEDSAVIVMSRNNEPVVVYRDGNKEVYLNSKYNPKGEAEKFLEEVKDMPEQAILTMFGFANGSFVREALRIVNDKVKIVIYEPSVDIFMQVINNIDLSDVLGDKRLSIAVEGINAEQFNVVFSGNLRAQNKNTCKHIKLPKYADLFISECNKYAEMLATAYDKLQMTQNTFIEMGELICKNNVLNMQYLPGSRSGEDFINHFPKDMPAIVVSAGPSLAKNKHLLKEAKGKALIMVVDTAINHVISMGVVPDMIITMDHAKLLKYFEGYDLSNIPFLVEPDSSNNALKLSKPNEVIFCATDVRLWANIMREQGTDLKFLDIGGSVATATIATLIKWGFKRIILIGQDLAFTGDVTHIGEESQKFDFSSGEYLYVKGIDGDDIVTRVDYHAYLKWIERHAYENPNVEFIDATEGGARIEHTKTMSFKDAIDKYCTTEYDIKGIINNVPKLLEDNGDQYVIDKLNKVKANLKNMKKRFSEGSLDSHKGAVMLSRGDFNVKELKRINANMQKVDDMFLNAEERELLSKISSEADNAFEEDMYQSETDDIKESIRMYNKCEQYYGSLADACVKLGEFIEECLMEMEGKNAK